MASIDKRQEYKDRVAALLAAWCSEKGIDTYLDQLLRLLDEEFLRTFAAIRNIPFPREREKASGKVPNRHWRYRFYHGVAAVIGWQERVTFGDDRYWGDDLHNAIKALWPDESPAIINDKRKLPPYSVKSSESRSCTLKSSLTVAPSSHVTYELRCSVNSPQQITDRKRRRLPDRSQYPRGSESENSGASANSETLSGSTA
ncbi:hypothetical protein R1sor_019292 [Riccia sorocarpa]|uniref:Uncharacterized protein n=1 Tax=Riccia sorocarpa TaxID=122646 RepID=A0ABD3IFW2_9MARC